MDILVQPLNRVIRVQPGANLLKALQDAQVPMSYSCMAGRCGTCRCRVLDGEVIKCWRAQALAGDGTPGTVLAASADGVDVACGEGMLRLTELQRPGGTRLPVRQFLHGKAMAPGQSFSPRPD